MEEVTILTRPLTVEKVACDRCDKPADFEILLPLGSIHSSFPKRPYLDHGNHGKLYTCLACTDELTSGAIAVSVSN